MREPNDVPEKVYVLLRVSGVRTPRPSYAQHVDPHRAFYEGRLRVIAATVEA